MHLLIIKLQFQKMFSCTNFHFESFCLCVQSLRVKMLIVFLENLICKLTETKKA